MPQDHCGMLRQSDGDAAVFKPVFFAAVIKAFFRREHDLLQCGIFADAQCPELEFFRYRTVVIVDEYGRLAFPVETSEGDHAAVITQHLDRAMLEFMTVAADADHLAVEVDHLLVFVSPGTAAKVDEVNLFNNN